MLYSTYQTFGGKMGMKRYILHITKLVILITFVLLPTFSFSSPSSVAFQESASEVMVNSLSEKPDSSFLKRLYTQLFFVPVWVKEDRLSAIGVELFEMIKTDRTLDRSTQLYADMEELEYYSNLLFIGGKPSLADSVDLEFRLSELYQRYAEYTLYGSINWGAFQAQLYNLRAKGITANWVTNKPKESPVKVLENAIFGGGLQAAFTQAEPHDYHYQALKKELIAYLDIQANDGWPTIPESETLKLGGSYGEVLPLVRERLRISGDYIGCEEETALYDECLQEAVERFQQRHGLKEDGEIGPKTLAVLNIPIEKRIATIRLNLDRIKWLIHRNVKRHIVINIPAFRLSFEEDGRLRQQMKVIIGKRKHPTPIFSNVVQHIVLNPFWNVPKSIIQNEMIPKLLRNPGAMRKEGIDVYTGWGRDAQKINPASVDWAQYRYSKSMPFRFAQPPGYKNALGKVKFLFPNQFTVYMHDTPTKHLFKREVRAFSHGCIRLEQPIELLKNFSTFNDNVDFKKAQKRLKGSKKQHIKLDTQVPVDVVYLTAWVDYDGVLHFRDDIYLYDKMQFSSMRNW